MFTLIGRCIDTLEGHTANCSDHLSPNGELWQGRQAVLRGRTGGRGFSPLRNMRNIRAFASISVCVPAHSRPSTQPVEEMPLQRTSDRVMAKQTCPEATSRPIQTNRDTYGSHLPLCRLF